MSTTSTPKPASPDVERRGLGCPSPFSSRLAFFAFLIGVAATAGIVVLSAFTSWWVLFALFGALPPLMMAGCLAMMSAIRDRIGNGPWFAGPCRWWLDAGTDRTPSGS